MHNNPQLLSSRLANIEELLKAQSLSTRSFFSLEQACQYLNISKSMLYKMTSGFKIPFSRPNGKLMYFRKEDLDAWAMSGWQEALA